MDTRFPVPSSSMMYSPGHTSPSSLTRPFASSKVCIASTKWRSPSLCTLKSGKGTRNETPIGARLVATLNSLAANPQKATFTGEKCRARSMHTSIPRATSGQLRTWRPLRLHGRKVLSDGYLSTALKHFSLGLPSLTRCAGRERISARRIHGYLGGVEAGRSEVREAGECSAAAVGHRASRNEALRRYG